MTSSATRVQAYRQRQRDKGEADSTRRYAKDHAKVSRRARAFHAPEHLPPFVACDGEGAGVDDLGRQLYQLFRMGERELYTGSPLTTEELLDFICDEPRGGILVGFAFGYDVTMILRDLPPKQQAKLFEPKDLGAGKSRFVWYKSFGIEYLPKQYLRVRREVTTRTLEGSEKRAPVKGSSRTIWETFGFFQSSFLKSITNFDCGTEQERKSIAENKSRRSEFINIDQVERDYCELECKLLTEMMSKLRDYCYAANIRPRSWSGAGKLASALHSLHGTVQSNALDEIVPKEVLNYANMAYYGGRFEITRTGLIGSKVYEYDIRSAYPDAMRNLPCLVHGRWRKMDLDGDFSKLTYIASIRFNHSDRGPGQLCGFPIRSREGHLYWPLQGAGVYWSCEIEAAKKLGATVEILDGWTYHTDCACTPYDWVEPLYEYRRSIGSSGPGYPIKLGINSLYGKLAQRKGAGKYTNMIHAGLITALTRAKLMDAAALAPGDIVMVATDAVYSKKSLELPLGDRLGEWEGQELADLFIVQPGLYWSPDKRKKKSRGLSGKFFEEKERTLEFERLWNNWCQAGGDFPAVPVNVTNFIGLKLALARGKPETAGIWKEEIRSISFDYSNKRDGHIFTDTCIVTNPKPGGKHCVSLPHRDFLKSGGQEPWENARIVFDEQPDYIDLGPPFED